MNVTLTASNEGLRLQAYDDATGDEITSGSIIKGNATLGRGIDVSKPFGGLELDEANFLYLYRLWRIRRSLAAYFTNWDDLSESRRAVLADVAFNRGMSRFMLMNLKVSVERGDFVLVAGAISNCEAARVNAKRYAENARIMADDIVLTDHSANADYSNITISTDIHQFVQECAS